MIKTLIQHFKEDPKTFILEVLTAISIFAMGYGLLLFGSILNGTA
jgi:hypothetical protein